MRGGRLQRAFATLSAAFRAPRSLKERALNASLWNVIAVLVAYPLRLASNLALTRLLAPEAFGLMAVITTAHLGLMLLSDVGIQQSVMREKEGGTPHFLRVAWTAQLLRGVGLAALLIGLGFAALILGPDLAAPGSIYADPTLPWLIWASSLMLLARGATSTKVMLARREMRLKGVIATDIGAQILGIVLMIALAFWLESVWALMIGAIVAAIAWVAATFIFLPGPSMRLVWDRERTAAMWSFGKWFIPASIGGFLLRHGDRLLFSALFDARLFGVYAIAIIWMEIGITLFLRIGSSVFMPVFSQLIREERSEALRRNYHRIFLIYTAAAGAMVAGYVFLIDDVIAFLYEPAYHAAGVMAALAVLRLMFLNAQVTNDYIVATGASRYSAFANLAAAAVAFTAALAAYRWFSAEAAIFAFACGGLALTLILQANPGVIRAFGFTRSVAVVAAGAVFGVAAILLVYFDTLFGGG